MSDLPATCPYCGDGMESIGTLNHIECVADLDATVERLKWMMSQVHILDRTEQECPRCDRMWSDLKQHWAERGTK